VFDRPRGGERAVLVRLGIGAPVDQEDLDEFAQLAESAGVSAATTITGRRDRPDPRYFLGSGKAEEVRDAVRDSCAEVVLVDHALSPSQERNLEKLVGVRVLDRSALILDIFAQRARSHEGKLEVELAQLRHLASRLVRGWTHLERQKGGIGLRGPGETQLETDRRLLGVRVKVLSKRLEKLQQQRETGRQRRVEIPIPSVALVGYTNAGKSTLFRALTGADAYVADQLFATLDPLVRRVDLPGGSPIVIADTVGFIRELPHELVAAFRSTLTEAREATLLLHVIDASDPRREERIEQVNAVLAEVGAGELPQVRIFNKIDRLGDTPPGCAACARRRAKPAPCGPGFTRPEPSAARRCCRTADSNGWSSCPTRKPGNCRHAKASKCSMRRNLVRLRMATYNPLPIRRPETPWHGTNRAAAPTTPGESAPPRTAMTPSAISSASSNRS
jgi:GTP-binding protein HflX